MVSSRRFGFIVSRFRLLPHTSIVTEKSIEALVCVWIFVNVTAQYGIVSTEWGLNVAPYLTESSLWMFECSRKVKPHKKVSTTVSFKQFVQIECMYCVWVQSKQKIRLILIQLLQGVCFGFLLLFNPAWKLFFFSSACCSKLMWSRNIAASNG